MNPHAGGEVAITELTGTEASPVRLLYRYTSLHYYDVSIVREPNGWRIELALKPFEDPVERTSESRFFEDFVEEPRAFAATLRGEQVGWLEVGYHKWNNRMRVWEILVKDGFRRRGIGTALMNHAIKLAKEKGARALVLETQTCNAPAIDFYLKQGFELVGFDATAYTNQDADRKEVKLELGLRL
jgi:ribosomal protein S18 acetylase RimI-like enzyme